MVERKAVRVNVSPERKEEWERVAEETNRNLSDTIRKAMNDLIMAHDGDGGADGAMPESVENQIYETGDTVERVHRQMNSLSNRFDVIENELERNKEARTVANEVYEILPGATETGNPTELLDGTETYKGTVEWIAGTLGETQAMVEQATDLLLAENYNVHETGTEDTIGPRYYKEGGDR